MYTPVLRTKRAEFSSLKEIDDTTRLHLFPFFELPPMPFGETSIEKHLTKSLNGINKGWGTGKAYVDLLYVANEQGIDSKHPTIYFFEAARQYNLNLIPVIGLERDKNYYHAIHDLISIGHKRICVRITKEEFGGTLLNNSLVALISLLRLRPNQVDVILDLGEIGQEDMGKLLGEISLTINSLPRINEWNNLTLLGTSRPSEMTKLSETGRIHRYEWLLWRRLRRRKDLKRIPSYGDYGVAPVKTASLNPRFMRPNAKMFYSTHDAWVYWKGSYWINNPDQFRKMCSFISGQSIFRGADYSAGDKRIIDCAVGAASVGNLETWIRASTTHHLTHVIEQLANLSEL